jgi:hypothetical protein
MKKRNIIFLAIGIIIAVGSSVAIADRMFPYDLPLSVLGGVMIGYNISKLE